MAQQKRPADDSAGLFCKEPISAFRAYWDERSMDLIYENRSQNVSRCIVITVTRL